MDHGRTGSSGSAPAMLSDRPNCSGPSADVLDIRTVFPRVSEIANKMLPHDALAMVFVDRDRHFVHQAKSPADFPDPPSVTFKTPIPDEQIIGDITADPLPVFEPADAFASGHCGRISLVAGCESPGP